MKTLTPFKNPGYRRGFTLVELLVAMTITLVLVSLTIVITGTAIDTWKAARSEIRASNQAKAMLNALGRDLESMILRDGTDAEWLYASAEDEGIGPDGQTSPNAVELYFFTAAPDRYNGNAGDPTRDEGGDISAVKYQLDYKDPVFGDQSDRFSTFVLYRNLIDPLDTYRGVIGTDNLKSDFDTFGGENELSDLVCENIYEFTTTFVIEYRDRQRGLQLSTVQLPIIATAGSQFTENRLSVTGGGIEPGENPSSPLRDGSIRAIEISITVLSDEGIRILQNRKFRTEEDEASFLEEFGFTYTKSVNIPRT